MKLFMPKCLSEEIRNPVSSRYMEGLDHTILNLFSDEVTVYFYMLCSFMENWICSNIDSCLAITVERSCMIVP